MLPGLLGACTSDGSDQLRLEIGLSNELNLRPMQCFNQDRIEAAEQSREIA